MNVRGRTSGFRVRFGLGIRIRIRIMVWLRLGVRFGLGIRIRITVRARVGLGIRIRITVRVRVGGYSQVPAPFAPKRCALVLIFWGAATSSACRVRGRHGWLIG